MQHAFTGEDLQFSQFPTQTWHASTLLPDKQSVNCSTCDKTALKQAEMGLERIS